MLRDETFHRFELRPLTGGLAADVTVLGAARPLDDDPGRRRVVRRPTREGPRPH